MRILLAHIHLPPSALLFMLFLDIAHLPKSRKHHFTGCTTRTRGLGANSANIIVQSRITGQLQEEKMQVYVRLGIRLLYKGATSRMEGARETFNEFFYRKLKPSARPVESLNDPYRLVSAADCRLMTFETVNETGNGGHGAGHFSWVIPGYGISRLTGDMLSNREFFPVLGFIVIYASLISMSASLTSNSTAPSGSPVGMAFVFAWAQVGVKQWFGRASGMLAMSKERQKGEARGFVAQETV
ncbi:hypothetical protein BDZ97DRAFT_2055155 [Flammula alnicola]|nr:hypothetical protein BDZ97DRAFT_2055155 [Flammula alnicola]